MSCVENVIQLRNLIAAASVFNKIKFAAMSIDLEKVFDRLSHEYLCRCLEKFNFPEPFIRIIRIFYCDANSSIQVNGSLTNSVRQGCPLSMMFIIYIESLLQRIAEEARFVVVGQDDITVLAYADDINYILYNEECKRVSQAIICFCFDSNAKVNYLIVLFLEDR
jgi:hypothetical protein